jgi:hypothetical protein
LCCPIKPSRIGMYAHYYPTTFWFLTYSISSRNTLLQL